ncbi:cytoplasmic iron level regulating protein YaaA (DUF328/UPF0246 family) [Acetoanaerobium pronyense]|uniref:UPF0246 protein J2Z35_000123 n=1 Tax=Acetoanaerobium pronyense TaxID=1482736 RepID=A0ABS4KEZ5_9FIRM|nr:YaaA family protein [Acetoanaerobium pronyense]MBP2026334.1 cytoplasmic iron level regulating protein YaaA (DUF328/UPF0246 family) [Acetoanaerobium pronyense]
MITFINSSKTMSFDDKGHKIKPSKPIFEDEANYLANKILDLGYEGMQEMMGVSNKLAELNFQRYIDFVNTNIKSPAIYAYKGDVYSGLKAELLSKEDLDFGQKHIRIISGIYGILKPLDEIKPYRMEMGYKFINNKKLDVYWNEILKKELKKEMKATGEIIINLSSKEYSAAINSAKNYSKWIDIEFLDSLRGEYKFITLYGKRARGMMARYIMNNKIDNPEDLKEFDYEGYMYSEERSTLDKFVFIRDEF